jgi:hypothetical protein
MPNLITLEVETASVTGELPENAASLPSKPEAGGRKGAARTFLTPLKKPPPFSRFPFFRRAGLNCVDSAFGRSMTTSILSRARKRHAYIVFVVEAGFMLAPLLRRTWARRGCTPQSKSRLALYKPEIPLEKGARIESLSAEANRCSTLE